MRSGFLFGVLASVLVTLVSTTPSKFRERLFRGGSEVIYRLPTTVVPHHYDIDIVPDFTNENSHFSGRVAISLKVATITNVIIVHSDELNIDQSATTLHSLVGNSAVAIATQNYDHLRHFYILSFTDNLPLGEYLLSFSFSGEYATDRYGFYRSSYQAGTETRWLVATQFKPTAARRAFPCFDEPGYKATFNVRIAHFQNQVALSNMPDVSTSAPDDTVGGRVWTQFQTTPPISTHLLAFIVSDFEKVSNDDGSFNVWSRTEALDTAAWALEATERIHPVFVRLLLAEDPWGTIAVTTGADFYDGALENWGLITHSEELLWQAGESSTRSRERVVSTISRELAQIWFGNLVSPKWWDHLWFSEGFATFYEHLVPSLHNSTWRFAERIVTDMQLPALVADSLETTRPMTNVVGNRDSILASFDNVASSKSAAVLRMLNRVMREDLFSQALSSFFVESAHGIFEPDTLWRHMQTVADANGVVQNHMPIADIMNSWVTQPGFPLVTVSRNYSTSVVTISQERFFMNPKSATADAETPRWWIPIIFATGYFPARCESAFIQPDWIRAQDKAIMIAGVGNDTWIIANCQAIGFFRTNYDERNWEMLTEYLGGPNFQQIGATNRAILIDNAFNLARAGYIDYSIALKLSSYLVQETDFVVWRTVISVFSYLNTILANQGHFSEWQAYQRSLVSHLYQSLGWAVDAADVHQIRLHREQILTLACQIDIPDARASAENQFNLWIANPQLNPIDPDLRSVVYCWGVRDASEETWDIMWNRFLTTSLATEGELLLRSLACSQNATILEKYLQLSITPNSGIRSQDTLSVFTSILTSVQDNVDLLLDFITQNAQTISDFYGGSHVVSSMLTSISDRITRQDQVEKLRTIANSEEVGASSAVIERALESANGNLEWITTSAPVIVDWLEDLDLDQEEEQEQEQEQDPTPSADTDDNGNGVATATGSLFSVFAFTAIAMCNYLYT